MALSNLEKLFSGKLTENGDDSHNTTGSKLLDILFMTEYLTNHLDEIKIGDSNEEKLFSMFVRDPRYGLGRRALGRKLMNLSKVSLPYMVKAGRWDDIFESDDISAAIALIWDAVKSGDELAKKWCPRFNTKGDALAKKFCKVLNISQKEYRTTIKTNTVENQLSHHQIENIDFEHVPSMAMMKYYKRFMKETRFKDYIEQVKNGEKKINTSVTNIYDIYKNRAVIDADIYFEKLTKIKLSCIPILDTSGSMGTADRGNECDALGKAVSIAYYLAKYSTYCPNQVVSFSSYPQLLTISEKKYATVHCYGDFGDTNRFSRELSSLYTGDCSNTDFGAVIELLSGLEQFPEYFIVLSDMEFDAGSQQSKTNVMNMFKDSGIKTKIVWWNFNSGNKTVPELDEYGNIFMSGYSPEMLQYLEVGFDGNSFLDKLLSTYAEKISK